MTAQPAMQSNAAYALLPGSRGTVTLRSEKATLMVCKSMVISTIMLSRFAIPLGGDKQIPVSFVVGLLHLAVILVPAGAGGAPARRGGCGGRQGRERNRFLKK